MENIVKLFSDPTFLEKFVSAYMLCFIIFGVSYGICRSGKKWFKEFF